MVVEVSPGVVVELSPSGVVVEVLGVVVDGVVVPFVPDSVASSGPVQSGSPMSWTPSPSSSAPFEH